MNLRFRRRDPGPDKDSDLDRLPPHLAAATQRGLDADPEAMARVRRRVAAEFRVRVAETAAPGAARLPAPAFRGLLSTRRSLMAFGLVGLLLPASFGLVAANSGPGDPFYGLRLAAESLDVPFIGGNAANRHIERLEERLAEAQHEFSRAAAVSAALMAYRDELPRALEAAGDDAGRAAVLRALDVHQVVLDELQNQVPSAAADGIQQAREQVGQAQQTLRAKASAAPKPGASAEPGASSSPTASPERAGRPTESRRPSNR